MNSVTCKSLAYWESNFITPTIGIYAPARRSISWEGVLAPFIATESTASRPRLVRTGSNRAKKKGIPWKNHAIFIHFYQP